MSAETVHSNPTLRDQIAEDLKRICTRALTRPTGREREFIFVEMQSDADARARFLDHPNLTRDALKKLPAFKNDFYEAVQQLRK